MDGEVSHALEIEPGSVAVRAWELYRGAARQDDGQLDAHDQAIGEPEVAVEGARDERVHQTIHALGVCGIGRLAADEGVDRDDAEAGVEDQPEAHVQVAEDIGAVSDQQSLAVEGRAEEAQVHASVGELGCCGRAERESEEERADEGGAHATRYCQARATRILRHGCQGRGRRATGCRLQTTTGRHRRRVARARRVHRCPHAVLS